MYVSRSFRHHEKNERVWPLGCHGEWKISAQIDLCEILSSSQDDVSFKVINSRRHPSKSG